MHVPKLGPCWTWQGRKAGKGYGVFSANGEKNFYVHRFSYALHIGPIPEGLHVLHRCDRPNCVRPDHLFVGTNLDNVRDAMRKGRLSKPPENRAVLAQWWKAHPDRYCKGETHGHAKLTEEQVRIIRQRERDGESQYALAREFGVSQSVIYRTCRRLTWRHVA